MGYGGKVVEREELVVRGGSGSLCHTLKKDCPG